MSSRTHLQAQNIRRTRAGLRLGASVAALIPVLALTVPAHAQSMQQLIAAQNAARPTTPNGGSGSANGGGGGASLTASQRAAAMQQLIRQQEITRRIDLAGAAQKAAREAALQAVTTTSVANGLKPGGLVVAEGSGFADVTWTGAERPTESTDQSGLVNVRIKQTESRAVLSWETFNVGANTALTFDQSGGGTPSDWTALNRVVGQYDSSGRRVTDVSKVQPSKILGSIKADGNVLVINPNGVIFSATSQVNVRSLVVTSLEIGRQSKTVPNASGTGTISVPTTLADRNSDFLRLGLLGIADSIRAGTQQGQQPAPLFQPVGVDPGNTGTVVDADAGEGGIIIESGARIQSETSGYIMMLAPTIDVGGRIDSNEGQVILQSGREFEVRRSTEGDTTAVQTGQRPDADIRGLFVVAGGSSQDPVDFVYIRPTAVLTSRRGSVLAGATSRGALLLDGHIFLSTSVSRNGAVRLTGKDIRLGTDSSLTILPDTPDGGSDAETIPQSESSVDEFRTSSVRIGFAEDTASSIEIASGAYILVPGGDVSIGSPVDGSSLAAGPDDSSRVFIDDGALIDVSGIKEQTLNVQRIFDTDAWRQTGAAEYVSTVVDASRNAIKISPVTRNELRDTPNYRDEVDDEDQPGDESVLRGAEVYVDPRLSGVREDGVRWVGSPLIEAESYYQQVGITASELLTGGGNVTIGTRLIGESNPDVVIRSGAVIDISGGWVRYAAGPVRTTKLITESGEIVDISRADPNVRYVGIASGYTYSVPKFGFSQTFYDPIGTGTRYESEYTEGRDAGTLRIASPSVVLDGSIMASAYAGLRQRIDARSGSGSSSIAGDGRALQAAPSELPAAGLLSILAVRTDETGVPSGGADIRIARDASGFAAAPSPYGNSVDAQSSVDAAGIITTSYARETRSGDALLSAERRGVILLNAEALSASGLGEVDLAGSGSFTLDSDAVLTLADGGGLGIVAGRTVTLDGSVTIASGRIDVETVVLPLGNAFTADDDTLAIGSYDIVVSGTLDVAGRFVNDFGLSDTRQGGGYLDGGAITLIGAANALTANPIDANSSIDVSGSILITEGALLDLSAGARVAPDGSIEPSGAGGDLTLVNQTRYFGEANFDTAPAAPTVALGDFTGFRVTGNNRGNFIQPTPDRINARINIAEGSVRAHGFEDAGALTVVTPAIALSDQPAETGFNLSQSLIAEAGFGAIDITSYATHIERNNFANALGGYNAVLATQTLRIGDGEQLNLSRQLLPTVLDDAQRQALIALPGGADLYSVLQPSVPVDSFDQRGIDLSLQGPIELIVDAGGSITGAAETTLTVNKLRNDGSIRIAGGRIVQREFTVFDESNAGQPVYAVRDLDEAFSKQTDGRYSENGGNLLGALLNGTSGPLLTNSQLAITRNIYLLGEMEQSQGLVFGANSITDLSGTVLIDPRTEVLPDGSRQIRNGRLVGGGSIETASPLRTESDQFSEPTLRDSEWVEALGAQRTGRRIDALQGSVIDLSGVSASLDRRTLNGSYVSTELWSNGGSLSVGAGGSIAQAQINAAGGAPLARDGTLSWVDPKLVQTVAEAEATGGLAADQIMASGFDTFIARGSVAALAATDLALERAFFLLSAPNDGQVSQTNSDAFVPLITTQADLAITAQHVGLISSIQQINAPVTGVAGSSRVSFTADSIDIQGAVRADASVATLSLNATRDLRLIGQVPLQLIPEFGLGGTVANSLVGQLLALGDIAVTARQVYPTTGTTFTLASLSETGRISFASSGASGAQAPYSAAGRLSVLASVIEQGGVLRAPFGSIRLGSGTETTIGTAIAPAAQSVTLLPGSLTSVSAEGLNIPYGTTTDGIEYFFTPTSDEELVSAPRGEVLIGAVSIDQQQGATIDLSGGGDVYAYEFVPGTGGSRDVLAREASDPYSSNDGLLYPDGRQVYAIVPSLADADVALADPIYGADYSDLYGASDVGRRVYLSGGPNGLAAGWYTLLPARYALLPGGMRVVVQSGSEGVTPEGFQSTALDGTVRVQGWFGDASGARDAEAVSLFVQTQDVFRKYSNILVTQGSEAFAEAAARKGITSSSLPADAGRLVLEPLESLALSGAVRGERGEYGRGAEIDIAGDAFAVLGAATPATSLDAIRLSAEQLSALDAASILIGGTRSQNDDGTTSLNITADTILVDTRGSTLSAGEVLLAVDGDGSSLTIADGSIVAAEGDVGNESTAAYVIDGSSDALTGAGAVVRVSTGPERLIERRGLEAVATAPELAIGSAQLLGGPAGGSVLAASSGGFTLAGDTVLGRITDGDDRLAIGANAVRFSNDPDATGDALILTPAVQALLGNADGLTILSVDAIVFDTGSYSFGDLTLDAPAIASDGSDDASVVIAADTLRLFNSDGTAESCSVTSSCGEGTLAISVRELLFGPGSVAAQGFGGGVALTASDGARYQGEGGFDAGSGALAVNTPYLVERGDFDPAAETKAPAPRFALTAGGAIAFTGSAGATIADDRTQPGSALVIRGDSVSVSGTRLRATAGRVDITAAGDVALSDGAVIDVPAYAAELGDELDPVSVSAPGGVARLTSTAGDIVVGAGTTINLGGEAGTAGSVELRAPAGEVVLAGTIDSTAPDGGGSFLIDTGGVFDLNAFAASAAAGFQTAIDITSRTGMLSLAQGSTLKSERVRLVSGDTNAAAGAAGVRIDGTIDVSGINGGRIELFAVHDVTLGATALLDAHADGYARTDTRPASGGDVVLGVSGSAITVEQGARIEVGARQAGDRLVPQLRNGQTIYTYVEADKGGTLTLRAPIVATSADEPSVGTVNIDFAGTLSGAREITLEAFESFSLREIADAGFSGVTFDADGNATIDVAAKAGTNNFFSFDWRNPASPVEDAEGGLVRFIQRFDVSASYAGLGGLAEQDGFHARPGVELVHDKAVTLASNWNLGAGSVDTDAAFADGVLVEIAGSDKLAVVAGLEDVLLRDYGRMIYRTDGAVLGEAPVIGIRAGGDLTVNASVTDGYFTFRDQTDPDYLAGVTGQGNSFIAPAITFNCPSNDCSRVPTYIDNNTAQRSSAAPFTVVSTAYQVTQAGITTAPYANAANNPWSEGAGTDGAGNPIGSADLFPLIDSAPMQSSSYRMVAGADAASADPTAMQAGSTASFRLIGERSYSYGGGFTFGDSIYVRLPNTTRFVPMEEFLAAVTSASNARDRLDAGDIVSIFTDQTTGARPNSSFDTLREDAAVDFFGTDASPVLAASLWARVRNGGAAQTTLYYTTLAEGINYYLSFQDEIVAAFRNPNDGINIPGEPSASTATATTVTYRNLMRTGSGEIAIAAAGNVDLRGSETPVMRTRSGGIPTADIAGFQVGGTTIYTAGTRTTLVNNQGLTPVEDARFGARNYATDGTSFDYGSSATTQNLRNILLPDVDYTDGGGDVRITAGSDVLGRRDLWQEARIQVDETRDFIGTANQPWRIGAITSDSINLLTNSGLFTAGIGSFGGGDVIVQAVGDVVDLQVASPTSVLTARDATGTLTQWEVGGGNIAVDAGGALLGGRIDAGRGTASITAVESIASAGTVLFSNGPATQTTGENLLRIRLANATVEVATGGSADIEGIGALGVQRASNSASASIQQFNSTSNVNSGGLYSPIAAISIRSVGSVSIANQGPTISNAETLQRPTEGLAVLPGSVEIVAVAGDLALGSAGSGDANTVALVPSSYGNLTLLAGGSIAPLSLNMEDGDPGLLPGLFSSYLFATTLQGFGRGYDFPSYRFDLSPTDLTAFHNAVPTHIDNPEPIRIAAGGDITELLASLPKQARIRAGRDLVDAVVIGQNISGGDITRISAGRDIIATSVVRDADYNAVPGPPVAAGAKPTLNGNTFVIGGPGSVIVEAGRNAGPFLNSATIPVGSINCSGCTLEEVLARNDEYNSRDYGGGIFAVGNDLNPALSDDGADLVVLYGVANGADYAALLDAYVNPANIDSFDDDLFAQREDDVGNQFADRDKPIYAAILFRWLEQNYPELLQETFGTSQIIDPAAYSADIRKEDGDGNYAAFTSASSAYQVALERPELFAKAYANFEQGYQLLQTLTPLQQQPFVLNEVYFNELAQNSIPTSPSFGKSYRNYLAVDTLFSPERGYTDNLATFQPVAGANTGDTDFFGDFEQRIDPDTGLPVVADRVQTGNLDLRLATIQTTRGGEITILGPGGSLVAGSVVRTSDQAARRNYDGQSQFAGQLSEDGGIAPEPILSIPTGYEGILTLRGGAIRSFTDGDLLLNQSRLFAQSGGDVTLFSSNGNLNAGQGPRSSANFPPVVVRLDADGNAQVDAAAGVTGAGIAAFSPQGETTLPSVFLIAPRGTVDAGDAGVRASGSLFIAAAQVANAEGFTAGGDVTGIPTASTVSPAASTNSASQAVAEAAKQAAGGDDRDPLSRIRVDVEGYVGDDPCLGPNPPANCPAG